MTDIVVCGWKTWAICGNGGASHRLTAVESIWNSIHVEGSVKWGERVEISGNKTIRQLIKRKLNQKKGEALQDFSCFFSWERDGGGSPYSEASLISRVVGSRVHMRVTHDSQSTAMIHWKWAARIQFIETSGLTAVRFILGCHEVTEDVRALCVPSSEDHQLLEGFISNLDSRGLFSITLCRSNMMALKSATFIPRFCSWYSTIFVWSIACELHHINAFNEIKMILTND